MIVFCTQSRSSVNVCDCVCVFTLVCWCCETGDINLFTPLSGSFSPLALPILLPSFICTSRLECQRTLCASAVSFSAESLSHLGMMNLDQAQEGYSISQILQNAQEGCYRVNCHECIKFYLGQNVWPEIYCKNQDCFQMILLTNAMVHWQLFFFHQRERFEYNFVLLIQWDSLVVSYDSVSLLNGCRAFIVISTFSLLSESAFQIS